LIRLTCDAELNLAVLLSKHPIRIVLKPSGVASTSNTNLPVAVPLRDSFEPKSGTISGSLIGGHGRKRCQSSTKRISKFEKGHNKLVARRVKDAVVTKLVPRAHFVQTWKVRNAGMDWPEGVHLVPCKGNRMGGPEVVPLTGKVASGCDAEVAVNLVAPQEPGTYKGLWRLCSMEGKKFGPRLLVVIEVVGSAPSDDEYVDHPAIRELADQAQRNERFAYERWNSYAC